MRYCAHVAFGAAGQVFLLGVKELDLSATEVGWEPGVHDRYCSCWGGMGGLAEFFNLGSGPRRKYLVGQ